MTPITPSRLRENVYRILDEVLSTGMPVDIVRDGHLLRIIQVDDESQSKLSRLEPHPEAVVGDPESLVDIDWSGEWRP